jgi:hypothetical protein
MQAGEEGGVEEGTWSFHRSYPSERHVLAVAVHGSRLGIEVREWRAA